MTGQHLRTNGNSIWSITGPNGVRSYGEVLAWDWSDSVVSGINQWYGEKSDWVNQTDEETGHYTQMIDPANLYVGIGTFCSSQTSYYNCTAGEFSSVSGLNESVMSFSGNCIQKLEVSLNYLYDCSFSGPNGFTGVAGDTETITVTVGTLYRYYTKNLIVLDEIVWSSSDDATASVDADGTVHSNYCGEAEISADLGGKAAVGTYTVNHTEVTDTAVDATCTEPGLTEGSHCGVCGEVFTAQETIPAIGHKWGDPAYTWSEDNQSVTAARVCANDASHIESETAQTTSESTEATCTENSKTTYTAVFENEIFARQTKVLENADAAGHNWGQAVYTWSEDNQSVTASRVCENDAAHAEIETVQTISVVTKEPTASAKGETTYTAEFSNDAFTAQTKTVADIDFISVTGVTLNKTAVTLAPKGTATLTAAVAPSDATNKNVTWTTSSSKVATVSNGKVTAVAAGTANITVKTADGSKTAVCKVTVTAPVTGVKLNKTSLTLSPKGTATLTATVSPTNAANKAVTWTSANKKIATVTSAGKITAVSYGKTTITATTKDGSKKAACTVWVLFKDVPLTNQYKDGVYWAASEGVAAGYSGSRAGIFGVNDGVTRGQFVMFLWRLAGQPAPKKKTQTFKDVPTSHSFYKAIQWASEQGIAAGYSGSKAGYFGPNDSVTRGQTLMFIWRYAGKPAPKKKTQTFKDVAASHNFYKPIQWAYEGGAAKKDSSGSFGVNTNCTRGECVSFMYELLQ